MLYFLSLSLLIRNNCDNFIFVLQIILDNYVNQLKDEVLIQQAISHHQFIVTSQVHWQNKGYIFQCKCLLTFLDIYVSGSCVLRFNGFLKFEFKNHTNYATKPYKLCNKTVQIMQQNRTNYIKYATFVRFL